MIIKKIILQNFRQFEGLNEIDLSLDPKSPERTVVFLEGDNSAGKTTLEAAFLWCLYGQNSFTDKVLLSRNMQQRMHDKLCHQEHKENEVKVCIEFDYGNEQCSLMRKQLYVKKNGKIVLVDDLNDAVTMSVSYQSSNGESKSYTLSEEVSIEQQIKDIIPETLSPYFFFRGEGIQAIANDINRSLEDASCCNKAFKDAVEKLVGLDYLTNAIKHFNDDKKGVLALLRKELKQQNANKEIKNLHDEYEQKERSFAQLKQKLETVENELQNYQQKLVSAENELNSFSGDNDRLTKYKELKSLIEQMQNEISSSAEEGRSLLVRDGLEEIVGTLVNGIYPENKVLGDTKVLDVSVELIDSLLARRRCICDRELTDSDIEKFEEMKKNLRSLQFTNETNLYKAKCDEYRIKSQRNLVAEIKTKQDKIERLFREYEKYCLALDKMDVEALSGENEKLKAIIEAKMKAENNVSRCLKECKEYRIEYSKQNEELDDLERKLDEANAKEEKLKKLLKASKYAEAVAKNLELQYKEKSALTREAFTTYINEYFNLIFKNERYESDLRLCVDDNYTLQLSGTKNNARIDNSGGQGDTIVFCFIAAVQQLVKTEVMGCASPLVMDAPFSNLDATRIGGVCDVLGGCFEQIILFIKNVDGKYAKQYLEKRIVRKYLLRKLGDYQTEIVEN